MRSFIVPVLVVTVCAEQFTVQSGVRAITEELESLNLRAGDQGTKHGVHALLSRVGESDPLDGDQKKTLVIAADMLRDILNSLKSDKVTSQNALDAVNANIALCPDPAIIASIAQTRANLDSDLADLTTCCEEAGDLYDTFQQDCTALHGELDSTSLSGCTDNLEHGKDKGEAWMTELSSLILQFTVKRTILLPLVTSCKQSTTSFQTKSSECIETKQREFETATCTWADAWVTRCEAETHCYANALASHATVVAEQFALANDRCKNAQVLTYIICLIDGLAGADVAPNLDALQATCTLGPVENQTLIAEYNNTEPGIDGKPPCVPPTLHPESDDWMTTYAGIPRCPSMTSVAIEQQVDTCWAT